MTGGAYLYFADAPTLRKDLAPGAARRSMWIAALISDLSDGAGLARSRSASYMPLAAHPGGADRRITGLQLPR